MTKFILTAGGKDIKYRTNRNGREITKYLSQTAGKANAAKTAEFIAKLHPNGSLGGRFKVSDGALVELAGNKLTHAIPMAGLPWFK
jgi:hypothetical protein